MEEEESRLAGITELGQKLNNLLGAENRLQSEINTEVETTQDR